MSSSNGASKSGGDKAAPVFSAHRLLLVGTGAVTVMHLPFWINWIYANYPDLEIQVVLSRSAERFVSPHALTPLTRHRVIADVWPSEPDTAALHVSLTEWAEAVAVFPATFNYLGRLAAGLADTPSLLVAQCTAAPLVLAPALPPGAEDNPVLKDNLERLNSRPNVAVAPTQPVRSLTTRRHEAAGAAPMWTVLRLLEDLRSSDVRV